MEKINVVYLYTNRFTVNKFQNWMEFSHNFLNIFIELIYHFQEFNCLSGLSSAGFGLDYVVTQQPLLPLGWTT